MSISPNKKLKMYKNNSNGKMLENRKTHHKDFDLCWKILLKVFLFKLTKSVVVVKSPAIALKRKKAIVSGEINLYSNFIK